MDEGLKAKIRSIVQSYERLMPEDFAIFSMSHREKVKNQDTKLSDLKGDYLEQLVFEVPEALDSLFISMLNHQEYAEFRTKESVRWFGKEFPQYRVAQKI